MFEEADLISRPRSATAVVWQTTGPRGHPTGAFSLRLRAWFKRAGGLERDPPALRDGVGRYFPALPWILLHPGR